MWMCCYCYRFFKHKKYLGSIRNSIYGCPHCKRTKYDKHKCYLITYERLSEHIIKREKKLNLLNKTSRTKTLPDWTRCLPEKKALALFHGLILTDGYIYGSRISYGSTSKNLRDWVADTAWRFGCPGVIREKKMQDGSSFYVWDSLREFTLNLVRKIADVFHAKVEDIFFSKVNNETLFVPAQRKRLRKKINKYVHAERVKSIRLLSEKPIVCITMVDSNTPL